MQDVLKDIKFLTCATKLIKILCVMKTALTVATIVFTVIKSADTIKRLKN